MKLLVELFLAMFAFVRVSGFAPSGMGVRIMQQSLRMSSPDPLEEIRAKMKSQPGYNPMQDPQAMQVLEGMIPAELKEIPNAVERLKVAMKDATTGTNAVPDLDKVAADFKGPKKDLISTPTSQWMKDGMPNDNPSFSESKKADLKAKVKAAFPEVPEQ